MLQFIFCLLVFFYFGILLIKNKKNKFLFISIIDILVLFSLFFMGIRDNLIIIFFSFLIINSIFYFLEDDMRDFSIGKTDLVFMIMNLAIVLFFSFSISNNLSVVKSFEISEYEIFFLFLLFITFFIFVYFVLLEAGKKNDA